MAWLAGKAVCRFVSMLRTIRPKTWRTNPLLIISCLVWLLSAVFTTTRLWVFAGSAGADGHPPQRWQQALPIALDSAKPTLIMLVHPQCPCSRASLTELNRLAALCPGRAVGYVLFLKPTGYTQAWTRSDLWRQASAIPGVTAREDDHGETARRLGAATSGETLVYAPSGRLLYQGGLTGERGHEGDNAGLSAVAAVLRGQIQSAKEPVYGCPLTSCPGSRESRRKQSPGGT